MFSFNLSKQSAFLAFAMSLAVMACQKDKETKPQVSEVGFKDVKVRRFHACGMAPAMTNQVQGVAENQTVITTKCCTMKGDHALEVLFNLALPEAVEPKEVSIQITDVQSAYRADETGIYAKKEILQADETGLYKFSRTGFGCAGFRDLAENKRSKPYNVVLTVLDNLGKTKTYRFVWQIQLLQGDFVVDANGNVSSELKPCAFQ
jgi:hypothetical protein